MENNKKIEKCGQIELFGKVFNAYGTIEEPLFKAKDICAWIHGKTEETYCITYTTIYTNIVSEENKSKCKIEGMCCSNVIMLNLSGVYDLIFKSRTPKAQECRGIIVGLLNNNNVA